MKIKGRGRRRKKEEDEQTEEKEYQDGEDEDNEENNDKDGLVTRYGSGEEASKPCSTEPFHVASSPISRHCWDTLPS